MPDLTPAAMHVFRRQHGNATAASSARPESLAKPAVVSSTRASCMWPTGRCISSSLILSRRNRDVPPSALFIRRDL